MLSSLHLELTQCTGVVNVGRTAETDTPFIAVPASNLLTVSQGENSARMSDQRQPLHEHNSQTHSSSQKRSPNTSESIVVTPLEKRQTVLALSPARPLPPGDRYDTLEVQRALSLSPRSRHSLRRIHDKPYSLDSLHNHSLTSSLAKIQVSLSQQHPVVQDAPQFDKHSNGPHCTPERRLDVEPVSVTETQMIDAPPTQLAGAPATALDLLDCEATQLVPFALPDASPDKKPAPLPSKITDAPVSTDVAVVVLKLQAQAASLSDTPMLLPEPQLQHQQDAVSTDVAVTPCAANEAATEHRPASLACTYPGALVPAAAAAMPAEGSIPAGSHPAKVTANKQHTSAQHEVCTDSTKQGAPISSKKLELAPTDPTAPLAGKQQSPAANVSSTEAQPSSKMGSQPETASMAAEQPSAPVHRSAAAVLQPRRISPVTANGPVADGASQHVRLFAHQTAASKAMQEAETGSQEDTHHQSNLHAPVRTTSCQKEPKPGRIVARWRGHCMQNQAEPAGLVQDWIVSLEGTQAEADALIEQCALLVLKSAANEGNEDLPWAVAVLETSKATLQVVAEQALNLPFADWRGTQEYIVADRLVWTGRLNPRCGNPITISLCSSNPDPESAWDPGCVQEYLCSPAEVQCRTTTFAVRGEIQNDLPNSSMSHVGSSAATWGDTQNTQLGTAGQQATAAAALMLSQLYDTDQHQPQQQAQHAAVATEGAPAGPTVADQAGLGTAMGDAVQQHVASVQQSHQEGGQTCAMVQATQILMEEFPATEIQHAEMVQSADCDGHSRIAAAVAHSVKEQACAAHTTQTPTSAAQQHVMPMPSILTKPAQQAPAKATATSPAQGTSADKAEQQVAAGMAAAVSAVSVEFKAPCPAEAGVASPTQHLQLLLTCQDISPDGKRAQHSPTSNADTESDKGSPGQLQLGLDTQLPLPGADIAKSPPGVLGWLGGGWSVPQGVPDAKAHPHGMSSQSDSQQLPDFTCHVADKQGAADATEVTPSGVRPPRGLSSTPLPQAAGASETRFHGSLTPNGLVKPTAQQAACMLQDSEEGPLVFPRPHCPPHQGFVAAHMLPCSSPAEQEGAEEHAGACQVSSTGAPPAGEKASGSAAQVAAPRNEATAEAAKAGNNKRVTKKRSQRKAKHQQTRPAPKGPSGMPYRAGLPAPRYASRPSKSPNPHVVPKSPVRIAAQQQQATRQTPKTAQQQTASKQAPVAAQQQTASKQAMHKAAAEPAAQEHVVMHSLCTLEQLPVACGTSPVPSPGPSSSPVVLPSADNLRSQGQGPGHRQGPYREQKQGGGVGQGQVMGREGFGPGMMGRGAAAAFCSARSQFQEPRNAYSFPDSECSDQEEDEARQQETGRAGSMPQASRAEAVPAAPPQHSRRQWQPKPTGKSSDKPQQSGAEDTAPPRTAAPGVAKLKRQKGNDGSIARTRPARKRQPPPRYDDMVGHSQLESEVLNAADHDSPPQFEAELAGPNAAPVSPSELSEPESDADDGPTASTKAGAPEAHQNRRHSNTSLSAKAPTGSGRACEANLEAQAGPSRASSDKIPSLGCSKCRHSHNGCRKCRGDRQAALQAAGLTGRAQNSSTAQHPKDTGKQTTKHRTSPCLAQQQDNQPSPHNVRQAKRKRNASLPDRDCQQRTEAPEQPATSHTERGCRTSVPGTSMEGPHMQPAAGQGSCRLRASSLASQERDPSGGDCSKARQSLPDLARQDIQCNAVAQVGSPAVDGMASPAHAAQGRSAKRQRRSSFGVVGGLGGPMPLAAYSFLWTGFTDQKQSSALQRKIMQLGGYLLDKLPTFQERRRASFGANFNTNQILVVPASAQHQRTAKYIYAKICGIPIVTEDWVYACANCQRLLPLDCHKQCEHVLRGPSDPHEVFRGCKVFLAGPEQSIGDFADLMQHAGAQLVRGLEEYPAPRSRSSPDALQQPCDCIISVGQEDADKKQQVQRLARRLRIPIRDRMWAMDGCDTGALNPPFARAPCPASPHNSPSPRLNPASTDRRRMQQPQTAVQTRHQANRNADACCADRGKKSGAEIGAGRRKRQRVELVVPESEHQDDRDDWPAGPCADPGCHTRQQSHSSASTGHEQGGLAGGDEQHQHATRSSRHKRRRVKAGGGSAPLRKGPGRGVEQVADVGRGSPEGQGGAGVIEDSVEEDSSLMCSPDMDDISSADLAQQLSSGQARHKQPAVRQHTAAEADQAFIGEIEWVGDPSGPPAGSGLTPSAHRTYYNAFTKGVNKVSLGDCLELAALPGDNLTRLVRLTALWSEPSQAGRRMLARCQRFYRVEETPLPNRFQANEVFSSQDIEDKVSLHAVLSKCSITSSNAQRHDTLGMHQYTCALEYDSTAVQLSMTVAL